MASGQSGEPNGKPASPGDQPVDLPRSTHDPPLQSNSPQKSVAVVDVPNNKGHEENDKNLGRFMKCISKQAGLTHSWVLTIAGLLLILSLVWLLLFTLLKSEVAPGGDLFKILILIVVAYFAGELMGTIRLPPLLGMLIAGIILRTCGFYKVSRNYVDLVIKLREMALTTILIKAGLGLDAPALLKLSFIVLRLSFIPCLAEAAAAAVIAYFVFDYPFIWGFMLGFMLSAVSPAVVVPTLLSLNERGYGRSKGISTLVIAASGLDDIVAISLFGVFLGMVFSTDNLTQQIMLGPLEMVIGLSLGIAWGFVCAIFPHRDDAYVTIKRSIMLGVGSFAGVLGCELIHYAGAGPLACITAAFVASFAWKNQGWSNNYHPVADFFSNFWILIQPMLFGLIGAEIDLLALHLQTVGMGLIVIFGALIIRTAACCLVVVGGNLNWKEIIFVNLAWLPKATVQAALGPVPLDEVRQNALRQSIEADPNDLLRGQQLLTIAVLSILITAPIGAIGISLTGPYLLSNEEEQKGSKSSASHDTESFTQIHSGSSDSRPPANETPMGVDSSMHMSEGTNETERSKTDGGTKV